MQNQQSSAIAALQARLDALTEVVALQARYVDILSDHLRLVDPSDPWGPIVAVNDAGASQ